MLSSNIKKSQRNISLPLGFYFIGMFEKANNLISIRKTLKELRYALRQQLEASNQQTSHTTTSPASPALSQSTQTAL